MSAYTTGHKSCVNALGVYCAQNQQHARPSRGRDHCRARQAPQRRHGRRRRDQHRDRGCDAGRHGRPHAPAQRLRRHRAHVLRGAGREVIMGGGTPFFLPQSDKAGKRKDDENYIEKFKAAGYRFATTATEMKAAGRRQGDQTPARPVPSRQSRRRARPPVAQEGHRVDATPTSPTSPTRRRWRIDILSKSAERLLPDGGVRPDRQVHPCARLGAGGLRHHHARQRREGRQALRCQAQRHADHRRRRPRPPRQHHRHL